MSPAQMILSTCPQSASTASNASMLAWISEKIATLTPCTLTSAITVDRSVSTFATVGGKPASSQPKDRTSPMWMTHSLHLVDRNNLRPERADHCHIGSVIHGANVFAKHESSRSEERRVGKEVN